jgi:Flp pilus assembly pilin Flp
MLFMHREDGQSLLEYGLVLVLVAVVIAAVLIILGPQIGNVYSRIIVCVPPTAACAG